MRFSAGRLLPSVAARRNWTWSSVTAADLGFAPGSMAVAEIDRRDLQLGLELCPAETGPQLRLQYVNRPVGEFLHIAMHPVATYHGDLVDMTVANGGAGLLLLGGDEVEASARYALRGCSRVLGTGRASSCRCNI
jgi:hypothetical protein